MGNKAPPPPNEKAPLPANLWWEIRKKNVYVNARNKLNNFIFFDPPVENKYGVNGNHKKEKS